MNNNIKDLINQAVQNILEKMGSEEKLNELNKKHSQKIHFIPKNYRVFGGILQSMNIQFGNFIEELMSLLIKNEGKYEIINEYSGNKQNNFTISSTNEIRIDSYISDCQTHEEGYCNIHFPELQQIIITDINANLKNTDKKSFKHDIDLLFKDKTTGIYYYLEIKYNDDHDTGKFVDINRKFIKTYAYLLEALNIKNTEKLVPILFFFTNKKMKGNIYIPENTNIKRGKKFFEEFLTSITYDDLNDYMTTLSESHEVISMFDELYKKVVKNSPEISFVT